MVACASALITVAESCCEERCLSVASEWWLFGQAKACALLLVYARLKWIPANRSRWALLKKDCIPGAWWASQIQGPPFRFMLGPSHVSKAHGYCSVQPNMENVSLFICHATLEEKHLKQLLSVLQAIRSTGLTLKPATSALKHFTS